MVKNEHNKNGTIYICYQGVGKSSTVNECDFFIDLESNNFKDENGYRTDDWYDYSEINYVNGKTKVTIICQKHGNFEQIPNNHLRGHGCPKCQYENIANKKRMSLQEFVEKANLIHGEERYNYTKVNYVNNNTKITIICNKHDKIKNDYCKNNNINLLRIRYDEDIENRLINIFGIEE